MLATYRKRLSELEAANNGEVSRRPAALTDAEARLAADGKSLHGQLARRTHDFEAPHPPSPPTANPNPGKFLQDQLARRTHEFEAEEARVKAAEHLEEATGRTGRRRSSLNIAKHLSASVSLPSIHS